MLYKQDVTESYGPSDNVERASAKVRVFHRNGNQNEFL